MTDFFFTFDWKRIQVFEVFERSQTTFYRLNRLHFINERDNNEQKGKLKIYTRRSITI